MTNGDFCQSSLTSTTRPPYSVNDNRHNSLRSVPGGLHLGLPSLPVSNAKRHFSLREIYERQFSFKEPSINSSNLYKSKNSYVPLFRGNWKLTVKISNGNKARSSSIYRLEVFIASGDNGSIKSEAHHQEDWKRIYTSVFFDLPKKNTEFTFQFKESDFRQSSRSGMILSFQVHNCKDNGDLKRKVLNQRVYLTELIVKRVMDFGFSQINFWRPRWMEVLVSIDQVLSLRESLTDSMSPFAES